MGSYSVAEDGVYYSTDSFGQSERNAKCVLKEQYAYKAEASHQKSRFHRQLSAFIEYCNKQIPAKSEKRYCEENGNADG